MITVAEAVKIVNEKNAAQRIAATISAEKFFAFRMLDRRSFPKSIHEIPLSTNMEAVDKATGKTFSINVLYDLPEDCESIDVSPYLSDADAKAYRSFSRMFGEE